jgi:hypothetical protein
LPTNKKQKKHSREKQAELGQQTRGSRIDRRLGMFGPSENTADRARSRSWNGRKTFSAIAGLGQDRDDTD